MKTGREFLEQFGAPLTLRKLDLWIKKEYISPERGRRGRGLAHRYTDRDARKIRYMLEEIEQGYAAADAHLRAEARIHEEDRPFALAVERDVVCRWLLQSALEPTCKSEIKESPMAARGYMRLPHSPDLLILDPDVDPEVSMQLAVEATEKRIPVLVSTASAASDGFPFADFIQKPYRLRQLRFKVSQLLRKATRGSEHRGGQW